jgi:hypothetical protein
VELLQRLCLWWLRRHYYRPQSTPRTRPSTHAARRRRRAICAIASGAWKAWIKNSARTPEEQKLAWSQIREDFKRIQVIDNDIAKHRASSEILDTKLVEKAATEIHKCAARLQVNLIFPKETAAPGEKSQNEYQISTLLSGLSGLIKRFVNNPVFGEVEVLDVQAAAAAKRDLERIIELSEQIKKKAQNDKQEVKQKWLFT